MYVVNEKIYSLDSKLILASVNQRQVLEYFLNTSIQLNVNIKSPIREDPNPGCRFVIDSESNLILFDYSKGTSYNIISLLMAYLNVDYKEVMGLIQKTFIYNKALVKTKEKESYIYTPPRFDLFIKQEHFTFEDYKIFDYIDRKILRNYNIIKASSYRLNDKDYFETAYIFNHKNFKQIYRPDLEKTERYRASTNYGLHDFSYDYSKLYSITTKSFLDAMVLDSLGLNVRFVLNEGHNFTKEELESYNPRSVNILLYDNDSSGKESIERVIKKTSNFFVGLIYPEIVKDSKDYIKYNKQELIEFHKTKINGFIKNIKY